MDSSSPVRQHERPVTEQAILLLLRPSWLSGLVCILLAMALVATIVVAQRYHGSTLQHEVVVWQTPATPEAAYEAAFNAEYGSSIWNTIAAGLSTGLFWAFCALVVYSVSYGIYEVVHTAKQFEHELEYVHVDRTRLIREAELRIAIRLATLVAWFVYVAAFFRNILPEVMEAAHVAAAQLGSLVSIIYLLVAMIVLPIALHIHIVLLRLLLFRTRVFGGQVS